MNEQIRELKNLIEDFEDLNTRAESMSDAWNSNDEYARAENDPGLQYELGNAIEAKIEQIERLCLKIGAKHEN